MNTTNWLHTNGQNKGYRIVYEMPVHSFFDTCKYTGAPLTVHNTPVVKILKGYFI